MVCFLELRRRVIFLVAFTGAATTLTYAGKKNNRTITTRQRTAALFNGLRCVNNQGPQPKFPFFSDSIWIIFIGIKRDGDVWEIPWHLPPSFIIKFTHVIMDWPLNLNSHRKYFSVNASKPDYLCLTLARQVYYPY